MKYDCNKVIKMSPVRKWKKPKKMYAVVVTNLPYACPDGTIVCPNEIWVAEDTATRTHAKQLSRNLRRVKGKTTTVKIERVR
jgi:hypothetical protein